MGERNDGKGQRNSESLMETFINSHSYRGLGDTMKLKICSLYRDEIVCVEMETDQYVSSTGEVYNPANLEEEIKLRAESTWDEVEREKENCAFGYFLTADEDAIDRDAEESVYEDNIVIEKDNTVLMWAEAGQIGYLDDYKALKEMFGEDIADNILLIRKLHLNRDPMAIREAEERMKVIEDIAILRKSIATSPEAVYMKNRDILRRG